MGLSISGRNATNQETDYYRCVNKVNINSPARFGNVFELLETETVVSGTRLKQFNGRPPDLSDIEGLKPSQGKEITSAIFGS